MTLTFLNAPTGNAPPYTGYTFSDTGSTLLSQIQSTLTTAGWTTIGTISSTYLFMYGTSIVGSFNCYVDFTVTAPSAGNANVYSLTIRAWSTSAKTSGSPASTHIVTWTAGQINRLWITADQESACLCMWNSNGGIDRGWGGIHFGFLNRIDTTDATAWMIGILHSASSYAYTYVQTMKSTGTNWTYIGSSSYWQNGAYNYNTANSQIPQTTYDILSRGFICSGSGTSDGANYNAFYQNWLGKLNYDNSVLISPYFYLEAKSASNLYGSVYYPFQLYYRGYVKYAYCGVASLNPCAIVVDPITGYGILSTGGTNWQGMRIF